jgi:hypothetical protein
MEKVLILHNYRSPSALRSFAMVYLLLYPGMSINVWWLLLLLMMEIISFLFFIAIFAPLFSLYASLYGLWSGKYIHSLLLFTNKFVKLKIIGIYCTLITSLMFVALYEVFIGQEDVFDGRGVDDLSAEPLARLTEFFFDSTDSRPIRVYSDIGNNNWSHDTYKDIADDRVMRRLEEHEIESHTRIEFKDDK